MAAANIVVLGAGVSGLTTALLLSKNPQYKITIVAKHMPGDYDAEYTSPWAGAGYLPFSKSGTKEAEWDKLTWHELHRLAKNVPEAGIHIQTTIIENRKKDAKSATAEWYGELLSVSPWWKDTVPDFKVVPTAELREGIDSATQFTSVCINTALYLPWLVSQCLKYGVVVQRAILSHISEAAKLHHSGAKADLVINCSGLLSCRLGGVEDQNVVPARGQIVVVRNAPGIMRMISGTDDGMEEAAYVIQRAGGGGTILGGTYQKGNWDPQPDPNQAVRIMKRCVELCPELTGGKGIEALSIVSHGVGLRPVRNGGVRLEIEKVDGFSVVHNYGHGGFGYQASYGCSTEVVRLVEQTLRT